MARAPLGSLLAAVAALAWCAPAHDGQGNEATSSGAYTVLWTRR